MSRYTETSFVNGSLTLCGTTFMAMNGSQKQRHGVFECECGKRIVVVVGRVKSGHTLSCGCKRSGKPGKWRTHSHTKTRHGKTTVSKTYRIWTTMKTRCTNPSHDKFEFYGGRGIRVCERWNRFENFMEDIGVIPDEMSLDRIDSNGNYEPSNVRLIPIKLQARNRRSNRFIEVNGQVKTLVEWVNEIGVVAYATVHGRISRGWTAIAALTTPCKKGPRV